MDSLIPMNFTLHNTLWVPGHFHSYMLMGVILWTLALVTYLFERASNESSSKVVNILAPGLIFIGGTVFVGSWYYSGATGVPRRMAEHYGGVGSVDKIASIAALVLLTGVALVLIEWVRLGMIARKNPGRGAEKAIEQAAPATPIPEMINKTGADYPMISTRPQLITAIAALTLTLVAFLPGIDTIVAEKAQWHHLQHGAQILFGMLLMVAFVHTPTFASLRCKSETMGIVAVVVGTFVLFALMIPSFYDTLESNSPVHMLYHLAIIAVGMFVGWALTSFGRFTAWLLFAMMATMGFAYGAGVGVII